MKLTKIPLVARILVGFIVGTAIGLVLSECCAPFGSVKAVVCPIIPFSLIVALALGINPILDMFETCCNVTGDNVCTYIVARKSGLPGPLRDEPRG